MFTKVEQTDHQPDDEVASVTVVAKESTKKRVSFSEPNQSVKIRLKRPKAPAVVVEEPIEEIAQDVKKKSSKCGARCRLGSCKACVCRRTSGSKCDDKCGCSPHTCTNR